MKISLLDKTVPFLSDKMFGLFFEDINYAADGGLYAEMIENRQFAFKQSWTELKDNSYHTQDAPDYAWSVFNKDGSCKMEYIKGDALCCNNPYYLKFTSFTENSTFTNKAYEGIFLQKNKSYKLTLWIRNVSLLKNIKLICQSSNLKTISINKNVKIKKTSGWQQINVVVTAKHTIKNGHFILSQGKGIIDYGYISFMPTDAVKGVFRKDLFNMLKQLSPGFLRFPGGCIVEGAVLSNRYNWKDTVGPTWQRKSNWSRWAVHDVFMGQEGTLPKYFPYYNQSYGIGFYEYFLLSELLGSAPLPVLNVGIACQFQSSQVCPVDSKEFDEYIQSALDLIEFANGSPNTKWGALRKQMGHKKPFNLKYIGLGNEQWQTDTVDFFERYTLFEKAIHAKYPNICLIGSAGPDVKTKNYFDAWNFYNTQVEYNKNFTCAVDEHYYMSPSWFYEHIKMYDNFSRNIPVFAGEFAAHTIHKENNLEAALAEAAFMTGLEKNADLIKFASVAPLFARKNFAQWTPDFIWFDGDSVIGTPGYYVQKIFGNYTGNIYIEHFAEFDNSTDKIFTTVTANKKNFFVKIVNASNTSTVLKSIDCSKKNLLQNKLKVFTLSTPSLNAKNELGKEEQVFLKQIECNKEVVIPEFSCTVIIIKK